MKKLHTMSNALNLMIVALNSGHKSSCQLNTNEMRELLDNVNKLEEYWLQKCDCQKKSEHQFPDFSRYAAQKQRSLGKGRPKFEINIEYFLLLRQYSFKMKNIAKILSINRTTLWRLLKEQGFESIDKWTDVTDNQLDDVISNVKKEHRVEKFQSLVF